MMYNYIKLLSINYLAYKVAYFCKDTKKTKKCKKVLVLGLNITFIHVPGETSDHIAVWLPGRKVLLPADDIYRNYPNLYAIRGTPPAMSSTGTPRSPR